MHRTIRRLAAGALTALAATAAVAAPAHAADALPSTCFWYGPYVKQNPGFNVAYPDTGAGYWSSLYRLPAGAKVVLHGKYPHARYQSIIAYNADTTTATDGVNDLQTQPDRGSRNPFLPGAIRAGNRHRSYTLTIVGEPPPAEASLREPNTLYAGVPNQTLQALALRVYVPDRGRDLTGDAGLPEVELHQADGGVLTGQAACDALGVQQRLLPIPFLTAAQYSALRDKPGAPAGFPAVNPLVWHAAYNSQFRFACLFSFNGAGCNPAIPPTRAVTLYPNVDNQYVQAFASRAFGKVLVLRGKLPTTPRTHDRFPIMVGGQLRYWSICQNEGYLTTAVADRLYDEQIPTDRAGNYTIVTSLPTDRPSNAHAKCGVAFLPWPANGDGFRASRRRPPDHPQHAAAGGLPQHRPGNARPRGRADRPRPLPAQRAVHQHPGLRAPRLQPRQAQVASAVAPPPGGATVLTCGRERAVEIAGDVSRRVRSVAVARFRRRPRAWGSRA